MKNKLKHPVQWRIQDFPKGVPTPKLGILNYYFAIFFAENCMKMKEFGPRGRPWCPPLDLPIVCTERKRLFFVQIVFNKGPNVDTEATDLA